MWGINPWDNDSAADWFSDLMEKTDLPALVRETLQLAEKQNDLDEDTSLLRSAAYCVLKFGRVYIWPIKTLESDLMLAIECLRRVRMDEEYCYNEDITIQINTELKELQDRLSDLKSKR